MEFKWILCLSVLLTTAENINIEKYHIMSNIEHRFANTNVTTHVINNADYPQETTFQMYLPKGAFISRFSMIIDGEEYIGEVKERNGTRIEYQKTINQNRAVSQVAKMTKDNNNFQVSVILDSKQEVTFLLMYQELLQRKQKVYQHVIYVNPSQVVQNFKIHVNIHESRKIKKLRIPGIVEDALNKEITGNTFTNVNMISPNKCEITCEPTMTQQLMDLGISESFNVEYDVDRVVDAGDIEVVGPYFVHFLAPEGLLPFTKNILFILDTSNSMSGQNMNNMKTAMSTILDDLQPGNHFNIMQFSNTFSRWSLGGFKQTSPNNIEHAKAWINSLTPKGGKYYMGALIEGFWRLDTQAKLLTSSPTANFIVLLTDGVPSTGDTNTATILKNIQMLKKTIDAVPMCLFCLGLGNKVDFRFLQELAVQSNGTAVKISEDEDTVLQIQKFYHEISSPILSDVVIKYSGVHTDNITRSRFQNYFTGSEMVTAGKITSNSWIEKYLRAEIFANALTGQWSRIIQIDLESRAKSAPARGALDDMERLWAYISINQLLEQMLATSDVTKRKEIRKKLVEISLQYNFVTPVTSLIVNKPRDISSEEIPEDTIETVPTAATTVATTNVSAASTTISNANQHGSDKNNGTTQLQVTPSVSYSSTEKETVTSKTSDPSGDSTGQQGGRVDYLIEQHSVTSTPPSGTSEISPTRSTVESGSIADQHLKGTSSTVPSSTSSTSEQSTTLASVTSTESVGQHLKDTSSGLPSSLSKTSDPTSTPVSVTSGNLGQSPKVTSSGSSTLTPKNTGAALNSNPLASTHSQTKVNSSSAPLDPLLEAVEPIWISEPNMMQMPDNINIQKLHITSDIYNHFVTTQIRETISNMGDSEADIIFTVYLPKAAFISNVSLFVNGREYTGDVRERNEDGIQQGDAMDKAGKQYPQQFMTSSWFQFSVTVGSNQQAEFMLTYQELLKRRLGVYQHAIYVYPGQAVQDFRIEINIQENQEITYLHIPNIRRDPDSEMSQTVNPLVSVRRSAFNRATIVYAPSSKEQLDFHELGIHGDFIVQYDVTRPQPAGNIQVMGDHFVHYISPAGLNATPKNIVFLVDTSASMAYSMLIEMKNALSIMLEKLHAEDRFNLISFSSKVSHWNKTGLQEVSQSNIRSAWQWVNRLYSTGGTYVKNALKEGLQHLNSYVAASPTRTAAAMLIFLTDGQPTDGAHYEVNQIRALYNTRQLPIYSLGFGPKVDFLFLQELSSQNWGFARRVYDDAETSMQLKAFYQEIFSPVLSDVIVSYRGGLVDPSSLSSTSFKYMFNGSEEIITGKLLPGIFPRMLRAEISGMRNNNRWFQELQVDLDLPDVQPPPDNAMNNIERLWAYHYIHHLLDKMMQTYDDLEREQFKEKVLEVATKYHYVTPVTAMYFTHPNGTTSQLRIIDPDLWSSIRMPTITLPPPTYPTQGGSGGNLIFPNKFYDNFNIQGLHIRSNIVFHYVTTTVKVFLFNMAYTDQEFSFNLRLPESAFISDFNLNISGIVYPGRVETKVTESADLPLIQETEQDTSFSNEFHAAVTVSGNQYVIMTIVYEELLQRKHGQYQHVINVNPGQVVQDFRIDVNTWEFGDIVDFYVPNIRQDPLNPMTPTDNPDVSLRRPAPHQVDVSYVPSPELQQSMSQYGIEGQFIVRFDVARDTEAGDIVIIRDYFAHFIAPKRINVSNKNIVFVIDISDSMAGTRLNQIKAAMPAILTQLHQEDYFNIIAYSDTIIYWRQNGLQEASFENLQDAVMWVMNLNAGIGSHLSFALNEGLLILEVHMGLNPSRLAASMLVFITDGNPEIQTPDQTLEEIRKLNNRRRISIYSFGLGDDVDFNFLQRLSAQNNGFARHIYSDSDASFQLQALYREISSPLLLDIDVGYPSDVVNMSTVTMISFKHFFSGGELVLAGMISDLNTEENLEAVVSAMSADGQWHKKTLVNIASARMLGPEDDSISLKRLWAYLTIQNLMHKMLASSNDDDIDIYRSQALQLSLEYHFVTPLTKMVISAPPLQNVDVNIKETNIIKRTIQPDISTPNVNQESNWDLELEIATDDEDSDTPQAKRTNPSLLLFIGLMPICPDIDIGLNNSNIIQLLYNPDLELTVNALYNSSPTSGRGHIEKLSITLGSEWLWFSPDGIWEGDWRRWRESVDQLNAELELNELDMNSIRIRLQDNITFRILQHEDRGISLLVLNSEGLRLNSYGIIGQFLKWKFTLSTSLSGPMEITDGSQAQLDAESTCKTITLPTSFWNEQTFGQNNVCWHISDVNQIIGGDLGLFKVQELWSDGASKDVPIC